jgi:hypothetical protein
VWHGSRDYEPSKRIEIMTTATTSKRLSVSEKNLQTAAARLLPKTRKLVSVEVDYLRRVLGKTATQSEIDEKVVAVRKLPWSSICGE